MKRVLILIVTTLVVVVCLGWNASNAFVFDGNEPHAYRSDNLLRLHILANSSSPDDQYLKRQVRDFVVQQTQGLFKEVTNVERAVEVTSSMLPTLQKSVQEYLQSQGRRVQVQMELGHFDFPTRTYGDVTLPAGEYQALRVILGEGEGNNWWCVLFPPLCLDEEKSLQDDQDLMALAYTGESGLQIEYRFKLLEKLEAVPQWVRANYQSLLRTAVMGSNGVVLARGEE